MDPETAAMIKAFGPYAAAIISALLGVVGYGRLQKSAEMSEKAVEKNAIDGARLLEQLNKALASVRAEIAASEFRVMRNSTAIEDKLEAKIERVSEEQARKYGDLNREIGEFKGALSEEAKSIRRHADRSSDQQARNAEYFAQEAAASMKKAEAMVAEIAGRLGERGA